MGRVRFIRRGRLRLSRRRRRRRRLHVEEEDSRFSMDQMSSVYLNLNALSSSSEEESLDVKKRDDLSVTFVCSSEEAGTRVNSEEVFSDEDFPAIFRARDIRVRRRWW